MSDDEAIEAIQQRMREVRGTLGDEVVDLVTSTRDITNWRKYVRANPWMCLAAATAVGYALVPKQAATTHWTKTDLKKLLREAQPLVTQPKRSRIRNEILSFVSHAALRALLGYLGNRMAASSMSPDVDDHAAVRRSPK